MQSSGDPEQDTQRIADLLKNGAHTLHHEDEAQQEEAAFEQESIDAILNGRTEKRQLGSRKGNTFSTANFAFQDTSVRLFPLCFGPDPTACDTPASGFSFQTDVLFGKAHGKLLLIATSLFVCSQEANHHQQNDTVCSVTILAISN